MHCGREPSPAISASRLGKRATEAADWMSKSLPLDSQGIPAKTVYYSHDQLLTLPTVTVKAERDPKGMRCRLLFSLSPTF
jgi:hypothetical protein